MGIKHTNTYHNAFTTTFTNILVILITMAFLVGCAAQKEAARQDAKQETTQQYQTKSSGGLDEGDILIEATPLGMKEGNFVIEIAMNTHSVDLGRFDLEKQMVLVFGGREFLPLSAFQPLGHHSRGTVAFATSELPQEFTLRITGIPREERREMRWP